MMAMASEGDDSISGFFSAMSRFMADRYGLHPALRGIRVDDELLNNVYKDTLGAVEGVYDSETRFIVVGKETMTWLRLLLDGGGALDKVFAAPPTPEQVDAARAYAALTLVILFHETLHSAQHSRGGDTDHQWKWFYNGGLALEEGITQLATNRGLNDFLTSAGFADPRIRRRPQDFEVYDAYAAFADELLSWVATTLGTSPDAELSAALPGAQGTWPTEIAARLAQVANPTGPEHIVADQRRQIASLIRKGAADLQRFGMENLTSVDVDMLAAHGRSAAQSLIATLNTTLTTPASRRPHVDRAIA